MEGNTYSEVFLFIAPAVKCSCIFSVLFLLLFRVASYEPMAYIKYFIEDLRNEILSYQFYLFMIPLARQPCLMFDLFVTVTDPILHVVFGWYSCFVYSRDFVC